jgi:Fe-S cluster assembly protein SufD
MSTAIAEQDVYRAQFSSIESGLPGSDLRWIRRLRQRGLDDFIALGFPTTKLENWKYTNVGPIRQMAFKPAIDHPFPAIPEVDVDEPVRLVFVNGRLAPALSSARARLGFHLLSIREALRDPARASVIETHLGRYTRTSDHAFAAWNTAFFTDGAYIEVPKEMACDQPVHLTFVAAGHTEPWASYPRNLIVAAEGSQLAFVETFIGPNDAVYLTNTVTEIDAGPGAIIDYYKVEQESSQGFHVASINARVDRDASLTCHSISFGGSLVRNDLNVALDGEGSHCTLNGLFTVDGERLVDNHTRIEHLRPHASSRESYKGVLSGNGKGVFNGAIAVHEHARKTDAVQYSKNLLLSKEAQINTKPQLEIRNNDVRCFHGATIGQIDTEAVFYLKSRGLAEGDAKRILVRGFACEIIDAIRVPTVRDRLAGLMEKWLQRVLEES